MKDVLGTEIEISDYIVYATRVGDTAVMKHGKILEFKDSLDWRGIKQLKIRVGERREETEPTRYNTNPERDGWLEHPRRIAVVEKAVKAENNFTAETE